MKRTTKRIGIVGATIALIAGVGASTAQALTQHDVRQSDFIAGLGDERSAGHHDFLKEGLHVYTDDSSSNAKSAEYYAPASSEIPTSGSYDWYGTEPGASSQIVFDTDADRTNAGSFNVLVGEQVYTSGAGDGDPLTDWWYTGGSTKAATNGITCPSTSGGSGSDCHGSLQQWHDANGMSNAEVYAYGYSLGSGVKGDGVLRSQTYGDDQYVFTDEAAATPTPTKNTSASHSTDRSGRTLTVDFASTSAPNSLQGTRVIWSVRTDSKTNAVVFYDSMGNGEHAVYRYRAPAGKHTVYIFKNGDLVNTKVINK